MLKFIELSHNSLQILEEWYEDEEVLRRLGGKLLLKQWFDYVQQNPNYFSWIVFENNEPVGNIDVEIEEDQTAYIGLLTNPSKRNQGYGKKMLKMLLEREELSQGAIIKAGIETDNMACIRCFQSVGFTEDGLDEDGFLSFIYHLNR